MVICNLGSNTAESKEFFAGIIANLNTLIDIEQQAKRVIDKLLASGLTDVTEIFQEHSEKKEKLLQAAEEHREALKKKYHELQASVNASYEQFEKNHSELKDLVRIIHT